MRSSTWPPGLRSPRRRCGRWRDWPSGSRSAVSRAAPASGRPTCWRRSAGTDRPRTLPGDEAFAAGRGELNRAYAEAWLACRYVAETYSVADLGRLYAELDRGRSLDEASRAVLGVDAAALTAGWQRFLVRQAGAR